MALEEPDDLEMEAMAGLAGGEAAGDGPAEEGQVAGKVEELVPDELIGEAEGTIHDPSGIQDDRVFE